MPSPDSNGMMMPDKTAKYDYNRPLTKTFGYRYGCKHKKNKQHQIYNGQADILVYRSPSVRRIIEIRFQILEYDHLPVSLLRRVLFVHFFQRREADFLESFCGNPGNIDLSFCKVSAVKSNLEARFTPCEAILTTTHYCAFPFAVLMEAIKVIRISRQRFSKRSYSSSVIIFVLASSRSQ